VKTPLQLRLRFALFLWGLLTAAAFVLPAALAYDGHKDTTAYDGGEAIIAYDDVSVLATGEQKTGVQGNGVLSAKFIESVAAKRATTTFQGMEVRAVRDLSHVDDATLQAMSRRGFAPDTVNGDQIVLHHLNQNPAGPLVEMPRANHSIWNPRQHPFGNTPGAGLTAEQRASFDAWRVEYWKSRAQQELTRRAGGQ
jgi:hypothetical protein